MKALILAGGFATRLRPLSCTRPKQLFPIANRPLLDWIIENLENNGVSEVIVAVNYMANTLKNHYELNPPKAKIAFSREERPLGTAGPIKKAEQYLKGKEPFFVINGDILFDIDLKEMMKIHRKNHAVATIAIRRVEDPSRFGVVDIDDNGIIQRFVEKPRDGAKNRLINAGAYLLNQEILGLIPQENRKVSIEREIFPTLAEEGKMRGYATEGLWIDIGTHPDYLQANYIILQEKIGKSLLGKNVKIHPEAKIVAPVAIGNNVTIEKKAKIGPLTAIGNGVTIGEGCNIEKTVIFPESCVSSFSSIKEAIIGEGSIIGSWVKIEKQTVIGDHCEVLDNVTLTKGVKVCPSKEVGESVLESCHVM